MKQLIGTKWLRVYWERVSRWDIWTTNKERRLILIRAWRIYISMGV